MAQYMVQFAYTAETWATLAKNPQDRSVPIRELAQKLGGRQVGFYYSFGEYDGVGLFELPGDTAAIATSLAVVAPGHIKAIKTTKLFTVEKTMEAMNKAGVSRSRDQVRDERGLSVHLAGAARSIKVCLRDCEKWSANTGMGG